MPSDLLTASVAHGRLCHARACRTRSRSSTKGRSAGPAPTW
jgi:hypothetical protein